MGPLSVLLNQVTYTHRQRVKDDVYGLTNYIRCLIPKVATFVQNNGVSVKLLALAGTIPIYYNSVQYNIPVEMFIPLNYPNECPKLFVRPTPTMTIKSNHPHVDMQGCVYLPYLHEWKPSSNLRGLVETACGVFSIEPPLFSRPAQAPSATPASFPTNSATPPPPASNNIAVVQPVSQPQPPVYVATPIAAAGANTGYIAANNANIVPVTSYPQSAPSSSSSSSSVRAVIPQSRSNPNLQGESDPLRRLNLQEEVTMKMQECIHKMHVKSTTEMSRELEIQGDLSRSQAAATASVKNLQSMIERMEEAIKEVEEKKKRILSESAKHKEMVASIQPEDHLQLYDEASAQIIQLYAQIQSIDDAFYYLDKALNNRENDSKMDLNAYLKGVRELAAQQFQYKFHLKKIERALELGGLAYSNSRPNSNTSLPSMASPTPVHTNANGLTAAQACLAAGETPTAVAVPTNHPVPNSVYLAAHNVSLMNNRYIPPRGYH